MATISRTGISNAATIESDHITRIIDALDGTSADIIYATGSFTGSFVGNVITGYQTTASGVYSNAEGFRTDASGGYSHAEGYDTTAIGYASHAEGFQTATYSTGSHAEGFRTEAIGAYSHAEGLFTVASGSYQHVQGQYNISSSAQSAFIVGNGTGAGALRSNLIFASGSAVQITGSLRVSGSITGSLLGTATTVSTYIGNDTGSLIKVNFGTRSSTATSSLGDLLSVGTFATDTGYIVRTDIVGVWDGGYHVGGTLMAVYDESLNLIGSINQIKNHNFAAAIPEFTYVRAVIGSPSPTGYTLGVAVSGMSTGTVAWKAVTYITPVVYTP